MSLSKRKRRRGRVFLRRRDAGKLKHVFVMENANWPWKVRACGHLKIVSSFFQSSHSLTHSFFIFLSHYREIVYNASCASNAIEPESGVEIFSYRFPDYGGQSVASGMSITLFLGAFSLQIWRHCRSWHLSNARKVSQKFGMTHSCSLSPVCNCQTDILALMEIKQSILLIC
jgi:hypothetical protein